MDERFEHGTMTVDEAAELLGVSRGVAYESAREYLRSGGMVGLPVIRLGRRLLVPVPALRRLLGYRDNATDAGR